MNSLEEALKVRIQSEEAKINSQMEPSSLWDHCLRVSKIAVSLGKDEGMNLELCRLAGLFHDAGKFWQGHYHLEEIPEEELSVKVLREFGLNYKLDKSVIEEVAGAILDLYRDAPSGSLLGKILFDADNLDKLGFLGVGNFFIKAGLRGKSISDKLLQSLTIELTYVRAAPKALLTSSGRQRAVVKSRQSEEFFRAFIEELKNDGLCSLAIREVKYDNIEILYVAPEHCKCGSNFELDIWESKGLKCITINLKQICPSCGICNELSFCRPRL